MTDPNKYNPYPPIATVRCPSCAGPAEFRKAFALTSKRHWEWWQDRLWPCAQATNWEGRERWVPGDERPDWQSWIIIEHDPALYAWKQPARGYRATDEGILRCTRCIGRRKHHLNWPSDAYWQVALPQGVLWAWSRSGLQAARDFIASTDRNAEAFAGAHYLYVRHIPQAFLAGKDRASILKRIDRVLS